MNIGALPRRCRPKVTRIGTYCLLHSRSAMPWRLTRDLISVVLRTELTSRGSSKPRTLCRTSHTFEVLANFARLGSCAANKTEKIIAFNYPFRVRSSRLAEARTLGHFAEPRTLSRFLQTSHASEPVRQINKKKISPFNCSFRVLSSRLEEARNLGHFAEPRTLSRSSAILGQTVDCGIH